MKKTIFLTLIAFAFCLTAAAQTITVEDKQPFISVNGTAKTTLEPNKVEILIQLSELPSKGKVTLADQQKQLATALSDAGVDMKKQLVVVSQSTAGDKRKISYQFINYLLTVSTAQQVGDLFAAFDQNGVQNAAIVRVTNDSQDEVRTKMRIQAMQNAQKLAQTLAGAIGQTIGAAIEINDYSRSNTDDQMLYAETRMSIKTANMSPELPSDLQLKPIEIEQTVSVKFVLVK